MLHIWNFKQNEEMVSGSWSFLESISDRLPQELTVENQAMFPPGQGASTSLKISPGAGFLCEDFIILEQQCLHRPRPEQGCNSVSMTVTWCQEVLQTWQDM